MANIHDEETPLQIRISVDEGKNLFIIEDTGVATFPPKRVRKNHESNLVMSS